MKALLRPAAIVSLLAAVVATPLLLRATGGALADLDAARRLNDRVMLEASSPIPKTAPLLPPGATMRVSDGTVANRALAGRLRAAAARSGILIERLAPDRDAAPVVAARITASGGEAAILAFAREIERGAPVVRFGRWRLVKDAGGPSLRLEARAVMAWEHT